jgi:hypothetical protein
LGDVWVRFLLIGLHRVHDPLFSPR